MAEAGFGVLTTTLCCFLFDRSEARCAVPGGPKVDAQASGLKATHHAVRTVMEIARFGRESRFGRPGKSAVWHNLRLRRLWDLRGGGDVR